MVIKNKLLDIIFSSSLIIIGSFLEIWFYHARFAADEMRPEWLPWVIGCGLTLFLNVLILTSRKIKKIAFLRPSIIIGCLILYSVMTTSAGQSFTFNAVLNVEKKESSGEVLIEKSISELESRINAIDKRTTELEKSIADEYLKFKDALVYKTFVIVGYENEKAALLKERIEKDKLLQTKRTELLSISQTVDNTIYKNIYEFYGNIFKWTGSQIIQFLFHTVLSIAIAGMAPVGIINLTIDKNSRQVLKVNKKPSSKMNMHEWENIVEFWVNQNWVGIRTHKSTSILPFSILKTLAFDNGKKVSFYKHKKIVEAAQKAKVLEDKKILQSNEQKAINDILKGLKK